MARIISGIQQVGIGVSNAAAAFNWYRKILGTDIVVFKDTAAAALMKQYTGNMVYEREAILAMNLQSGGGIEIWQYTNRTPQPPAFDLQLGDTGIFAVKIKSKNVHKTYQQYQQQKVNLLTMPAKNLLGKFHFFFKDPYQNIFEIVEDDYWFTDDKNKLTGGVAGALIGVSDMQKSLSFYQLVLGYNTVLINENNVFEDWKGIAGDEYIFHRVILTNSQPAMGAFGKLLGPHYIELIQVKNRQPKKIFENRFWGDLGFIHVCYDIHDMDAHEKICDQYHCPLTVNSKNSFEMGEAAGQFAYNEDPDGTLIEYVETHKVPVIKKMGLYLNLKKRNSQKPLPDWIVKCLRFSRVK